MSGDPIVSWMRGEWRKEAAKAALIGLLGMAVAVLFCLGVAVIW